MCGNRFIFFDYVRKLGLYNDRVERLFDLFFTELQIANQKVNLYSRQMPDHEIWLRHFLDSVSIYEIFSDFSAKRVLDFGSGGGMPGIPVQILSPDCEMTLLDSTKKKMESVKDILHLLSLDSTSILTHRIEMPPLSKLGGRYDIVLSRGVRITSPVAKAIKNLLTPDGKLFLYKAKDMEDTDIFLHKVIHRLDLSYLGERNIVEINYG
jgi:16S rRNA (guanine527-N7)-methyltransferase